MKVKQAEKAEVKRSMGQVMKKDRVSSMIQTPVPIVSRISVLLTGMLKEGLAVTDETLFFLESTYGIRPAELEGVAGDPCFEDRHILINLLFSPTQKMRENLEPLLVAEPLSKENIRRISGRIAGEILEIRMHMPGGSSFFWSVNDEAIDHFVEKFYLGRQLDPFITPVLQVQLPEECATRVRVFMRCRNFFFSEEARFFMLMCIDQAADRVELFESTVELLLTLTSQVPAQMTIVEYLHEQREYQKKRLCDIEEFEQKNQRYGLEYLLMQNYPVPHESEENVAALLRQYDIIIDELLDLQNPKERYINRRNLGSFDRNDDLGKLFRSLS